MQKKWFFIIVSMLPGLIMAAESPEFIKLPAERLTSGLITVDEVNINQLDKAVGKTFKKLINEAQQDNKPWNMVAYWCELNGALERHYASLNTMNQHPHYGKMQACTSYKVTKEVSGKYKVTRLPDNH